MANVLASGQTYQHMEEKEKEKYLKIFTGSPNEMILLSPGNITIPKEYLHYQKKIFNFQFLSDDVVIMTYSKCGTTWMQEIIWTMRNNPNLDNPDADLPLFARSPFLESDLLFSGNTEDNQKSEMIQKMMEKFNQICPGKNPEDGVQIQMLEAVKSRRTIKTHLPFSMLDPKLLSTCKVIFVARNPKDAVLSFQHHHRLIKSHGYVGDQDTFVDYFVNNKLMFGSFATVVKEAWQQKDHPNMHFVFFEDLKENIVSELAKLNDFIGTGLDKKQMENVRDHTSFNSMKARDPLKITNSPMIRADVLKQDGGFIRQGKAGSWRGKMTDEQSKKIDDYVAKNFQGTGLQFKF